MRGGGFGLPAATPTPSVRYVEIVTAGQNISPGTQISESMLGTIKIPESNLVTEEFTNKADVVGQYAKYQIAQNVPIMASMVSATAGNVNLPGSTWAPLIPQGLTAIAIPITRLSSTAFGIRDGDYVNVIVTMLLVDVDANYQSLTPNSTTGVLAPNSRTIMVGGGQSTNPTGALTSGEDILNLTAESVSGAFLSPQGRVEFDASLQVPFYIVPSETQRPRLVTQLVMQNVQVLHMGTFLLPGETSGGLVSSQPSGTATPGPTAQAQVSQVTRPDIITLMVTPQDAVTLTYLIYSGAQLTLTLRNPNDIDLRSTTEAATLQYLLSQYNIPVPAKLPYSMQPRIDDLLIPTLPNDTIVISAK